MKDEFTVETGGGWTVAGILTHLEGAVLTSSVGDGGLAGILDMTDPLRTACNDAAFGRVEGEMG